MIESLFFHVEITLKLVFENAKEGAKEGRKGWHSMIQAESED